MEITRQAGALGAIVTGVDLATVDDATYKELRDALLEHLVICVRGQGHVTPDEQVAFSARWGRIEPHPYVPPIEGTPRSCGSTTRTRSPSRGTPTSPTRSSRPRSACSSRVIPEYGGDTMFSNGYLAYEGLSDGLRRRSTVCGRSHYATQLAIDSGMPDDEIVNSHPVVCTHPETGKRALFVNDNYTRHFDGWSIDDSRRCSTTSTPSSPGSSTPGATGGRKATCSSGTTAVCSTRSSATPPGRSAHCTAPRSQEVHRHDRHPLDRQPRRPRRGTARRLDQAAPGEVPRRRTARRDGSGRDADPRRWRLPRGAGNRRSRCRLVVLRGPAVLGEAPDRGGRVSRRRDRVRRHHLRPDAPRLLATEGAPRRHDDEPRRGVAGFPQLPAVLRADLPQGEGPGTGPSVRRGVQRLAGRGMVPRAAMAA